MDLLDMHRERAHKIRKRYRKEREADLKARGITEIEGRHMIATLAYCDCNYSPEGELSSDEPDLCWIEMEDACCWIGKWMTGFGFLEVHFPKKTTRPLTDEEVELYNGVQYVIGAPRMDALGNLYIEPSYVTRPNLVEFHDPQT